MLFIEYSIFRSIQIVKKVLIKTHVHNVYVLIYFSSLINWQVLSFQCEFGHFIRIFYSNLFPNLFWSFLICLLIFQTSPCWKQQLVFCHFSSSFLSRFEPVETHLYPSVPSFLNDIRSFLYKCLRSCLFCQRYQLISILSIFFFTDNQIDILIFSFYY